MKKLLFSAALLLASIGMQAETVGDTLVIKDVDKVTIVTNDTVQHLKLRGADFSSKFKYDQRIAISSPEAVRREFSSMKDFNKIKLTKNKKDKKGAWDMSAHFNVGYNTMTGTPSGYSFKVWPSWEIGLALTADYYPYGPKNSWSIGLGVDWRNYRSSSSKRWKKTDTREMVVEDYPTNYSDRTTSLYTFSLQIPILYTHTFDADGNWQLTLGAFVSFNTGAHATNSYTDDIDNTEYDQHIYKIGQRPVTIDFFVSFSNLYLKYCPMTYFRDNRGPKGHQLSFGIFL